MDQKPRDDLPPTRDYPLTDGLGDPRNRTSWDRVRAKRAIGTSYHCCSSPPSLPLAVGSSLRATGQRPQARGLRRTQPPLVRHDLDRT